MSTEAEDPGTNICWLVGFLSHAQLGQKLRGSFNLSALYRAIRKRGCDCDHYRGGVYCAIAFFIWGAPLKAITLRYADLKLCDCNRPVIKTKNFK